MAMQAPISGLSLASSPSSSLPATSKRVLVARRPPKTSFFNGGGPSFAKIARRNHHTVFEQKIPSLKLWCLASKIVCKAAKTRNYEGKVTLSSRRSAIGLALVVPSLGLVTIDTNGAGLPPEQKPKLCDDACEKELENVPMVTTESGLQYKDIKIGEGPSPPVGFQVAADYVAMVPSGQIFDSSLEKGQPYIFRVGSDQVIRGLDEGILTMKVGGKRRLYIPGSLAFPKGLISAPGRPRVAPNSPVVFDVSLQYIPGLDDE